MDRGFSVILEGLGVYIINKGSKDLGKGMVSIYTTYIRKYK